MTEKKEMEERLVKCELLVIESGEVREKQMAMEQMEKVVEDERRMEKVDENGTTVDGKWIFEIMRR